MLKTFSITDIGKKRTSNQDFAYTCETKVGNLPNLFVVADGMGGYNGGGFASKCATETVTEVISKSGETTVRKLFEEAINEANRTIYQKATSDMELKGMGTTLVLASVVDDCLHVANVGDSRLYVLGDEIRQVTTDHSYVEEMIRVGGLDRESARNHPKKNIITRAIGAEDKVTADYFTVRLTEGQTVLMCSDGLTNMVEDDEILRIVKSQRDIAGKAEALVKAANDKGGRDNIAVVVVEPFGN